MTRINLVDPSLLIDAHLGAEYRELPRIYGLVRHAVARGEAPENTRNPPAYVLGAGHCRFFYPRLGFLVHRHRLLIQECKARGRVVNFDDVIAVTRGIPSEWFGTWQPSNAEIELSIKRLNERGGLRVRPQFQTA